MESKINEEINFWIYVNKYMVIYEKRKKSKKKKKRERDLAPSAQGQRLAVA